jgi:hypothetical protein
MKQPVITIVCLIVVLVFVAGCKPALSQKTAGKLIPNGMSETQVYEMLGTNSSVSFGQHGEKIVWYFFRFTGQPPKIETKIDTMGVVFSNGVVIDRQFASP